MLDSIRSGARSFGVMLIFGIIILVFVFWGVGNYNAPSSRTLAEVNGETVTIEDFRPVYAQVIAEALKTDSALLGDAAKVQQYKMGVLQDLVKRKVILQAAEKIGIVVTPQEIRKSIDSIPAFQNQEGKFDKNAFEAVLSSQRIPQDAFLDDVAQSILERKLLLYVQRSAGVDEAEEKINYSFALEKRKAQYVLFKPSEYLDKVNLTEEELRKEYESGKESFRTSRMVNVDYLPLTPDTLAAGYPVSDAEAREYFDKNTEAFRKPERVLLRHIFISFPVAGEHGRPLEKEAREKAADEVMKKAREELAQGKDFAAVAMAYSHDQQSAQNGGMLDWIERGDVPIKEFEDAAFSLKKGETSQVVASAQGLHLLRLEDKEEERQPDFAENKAAIIKKLGAEKADAAFADTQKQAEDGLALGSSLAEMGAKLQVEVRHTGMIPEAELPMTLTLKDESRQALLDAIAAMLDGSETAAPAASNATASAHPVRQAARLLPVPLNIENGIVLVRVNEVTPSFIKPYESVREDIRQRLQSERALVMAREEAEKALPSFKGKEAPEAFKDKTEISNEGARAFPIMEPFGSAQQLINGIFSSNGEWLPQVYDTNLGPVIARCASVAEVTDEEWEQFKGIFMAQRVEFRRNQVLQAFMDGLDENLKFSVNTQLLESLSADLR